MKRFHILILAVAAMVAAVACGPKKAAPVIPDTAYAEYVKAYTGGTVSSRSVIRVDLVEAVPEEARTPVRRERNHNRNIPSKSRICPFVPAAISVHRPNLRMFV